MKNERKMTMPTPMITALQKAKPIITKNTMKVQMEDLTIPLEKGEFIESLLCQYTHLLHVENQYKERIHTIIDTDFAGNLPSNVGGFVIQEVKTPGDEDQRFAFKGFYPEKEAEDEETNDSETKMIQKDISWDELKLWCEYVLVACGKYNELVALEERIQNELKKEEEYEREHLEKTTAEMGDIVIHPSGIIDYQAVWVIDEKDDIRVLVDIDNLHEIADAIEDGASEEILNSAYDHSTDEYIELSWGAKNFKMTFVDKKRTGKVKLNPTQAEQLAKKIRVIVEHAYMF